MKKELLWDKSILENDNIKNEFSNYTNTDILIIGGGIAGVSTAYFLKDTDKKTVVIDKDKIGLGITSKSTAKVTFLQKDIYSNLAKTLNENISKEYLNSQIDAINLMIDIIKKEKIDCDLEKCNSYIFTKEEKGIKKLLKEKEILDKFGINNTLTNSIPIKDFKIKKALMVDNTYTINPIKYLYHLKKIINKNIDIYENTLVKNISVNDNKIEVKTNKGKIICNDVIICSWYPFFIFPGLIPIKTYIKREYVNAAKYENKYNFTAISIDNNLHSIRFYNDYIIYGSNSHRLTNKLDYSKNYLKSQSDFKRLFSKEPEYTWMNQDVMTNDNLPLIGKLNDNEHILIATGFNAWGMTNATIAGKILSNFVLNKSDKYESLFSPKRNNTTNVINSLIGILHYSKAYIETTLKKNQLTYDKTHTVKIEGKYYGVYYEDNKRHIINLKCPHMKCNLVFNNYEKTWDCPCHGSRFDIDGNIINGPSKKEIKKNQKN